MHDIYVCVKKKCEQRHFLQVLPEWKSYDSLPHVDLAESYPPAFQQTYVLSFPSGLAKTNFTLILNQYFVLSKFQTPEVVSVKKIDISNLYCFLWFVHVLYFHAASHIIFAELNNFSWSLITSFIHPPHITTSKENFQTLTSNSILFYIHIMIIHVLS